MINPSENKTSGDGGSRIVISIKRLMGQSETSIILATLVLFAIFAIGSPSFLSHYNIFNLSRNLALYFFVAIGQAIVIIIGGMNLSLGSIGGLAVITSGICMDQLGLPGWLAVLASLFIGALAGLFNGLIIVKLRLNSFVVTLATSFIFAGLVQGISRGYSYTKIPVSFTIIGRNGLFGISYIFWLMIIFLVLIWYIFKYTVLGRRFLATGGNETTARLSGIKTSKIVLLANVLSGLLAGVAGLLWVSRLGSAPPDTGSDWMIMSFAIAVIGGTSLVGGEISAVGLFVSAIMITFIKNGLVMLNVNDFFEQTFLGTIILLAVMVESFRLRIRRKARLNN